MLKPRLFFILFCPIVVFLTAIDASASSLCGDFYEDRSDRHTALDFFKQFRNDSLPFGFQRLSRKKDNFDIFLLEQSYAVGGIHRPVEMGLIELLDFKGNVLDYQQVIGNYKYIDGLNMTAIRMLDRNKNQLERIAAVRKRHTHPKELNITIIPHAFSDTDINHDQMLRTYMNQHGYHHVRLEAWITYLNVDLTTHEPAELTFSDVKTRGYLVK